MEQPIIIRHRAGLVVRLIDTATGREIRQAGIRFERNGETLVPAQRADGKQVFLNFPAEECALAVKADGFIRQEAQVTAEQLAGRPPVVELHLVPDEIYAMLWHCGTVEGVQPDIERIDAVRLSDAACLAQSFDEKRRILTLFNPHHLMLDRTYYAVVNPDVCRYEPIEILERCGEQKFRLAESLQQPFGNYFPVARRILGAVLDNGRYVLRVPEDASDRRWLVRWRSGGKDHFQTVDFALPDTVKLRSPPEERTENDVEA